jgi:RNA polymerase-associated protein
MLDVAIAPLLWRLDYYGIELSPKTRRRCSSTPNAFSRALPTSRRSRPSEKVMRK